MTYWHTNKKYIDPVIKAFQNINGESNILVVDGGAAGSISEPFDACPEVAQFIRFEPRGKAAINSCPNDIYINGGLWEEDTTSLKLHVAVEPSTSSICPPNIQFLENYDDKYGAPTRETVKKLDVKLRSIDSCTKNNELRMPNFIKLDIHSAELPALLGAKNSLDQCVGLLVETWNSEVHLGQGLHHQVEKFALENGFQVYDSICAARWWHKHQGSIDKTDKRQYIGTEMLFIRSNVEQHLIIKQAFILALFGFGNQAKNVLLNHKDQHRVKEIMGSISEMQRIKQQNRGIKFIVSKLINRIFQTIRSR